MKPWVILLLLLTLPLGSAWADIMFSYDVVGLDLSFDGQKLTGTGTVVSVTGKGTPVNNGVTSTFSSGSTITFDAGPLIDFLDLAGALVTSPPMLPFWKFGTSFSTGHLEIIGGVHLGTGDIAPPAKIFDGTLGPDILLSTDFGCCYDLFFAFVGQTNSDLAAFYGISAGTWSGSTFFAHWGARAAFRSAECFHIAWRRGRGGRNRSCPRALLRVPSAGVYCWLRLGSPTGSLAGRARQVRPIVHLPGDL
jgi:hypothetical protein